MMVWFYGGAYQIGAISAYPGHFMAAKGVVMVAVTYRTNIFGMDNAKCIHDK